MKNAELAQFLVSYSAFLFGEPYGGLPFPTYGVSLGKEKRSRIDARIFPNPNVGFIVFPDRVTTKKATLLGGIRGDLIGTRTRVCAVRGRRPNR